MEKSSLIDKCDAVYVWHKDVIYSMAHRAVGGDELWALGIVEECMTTVCKNIDKFHDEKTEGAKAMMIAVYYGVMDKIYSGVQRKMGLRADQNKVSVTSKDEHDVNQVLIRNEGTAGLMKYVENLKNDEKEFIFLRFFMGLTDEEAALHFGITPDEAAKRLFLIKQKIAKMMMER